jgi:hypothetical protein
MNRSAESALTTLQLAVDEAEAAVTEAADAHEAWTIATTIGDAFREATSRVARLRAVAALRIKDQDSLSLRGLASKIGVSHQRAQVLLNSAKSEASHE